MARTLVGILQILLKQDVTQKAPAINRALQSIEQQANRLGNAKWGAGFERQLDRLKVSPAERAAIVQSYDRLARDINGKINRADLTAWRHGTLAHLTSVRAGLKETAAQAKQMHTAITGAKTTAGNLAKPALVALGAYTGWYAAGIAMREGFNAAGERQREVFRQDMAGIPAVEQAHIAAEAQRLTIEHPSVGMTEIMEMARTARNTMGSTDEGLAILEDMVRGLVTLQSSQGVDAGASSMMRLIRGLDNLGLNSGGEIGLASMREVIAGAIRAAQIEGGEIDVGQYFDFARRAKVAGPALSDEFLATTSAALMQDMTASGAGNAIAMLFKSFVLGDNSINGKVYKERQRDLGIRDENNALVDSRMMGENPYQWTKTYLIPALQAAGVDLTNDTDVAAEVGKLSGNTNATGLLTRMITQSEQIERLIGMYAQAMGPEAADTARERDPFVAAEGFTSALGNLSAALGEHVMPVIVPALNSLTDTINSIAAATREGSGWDVGLASLGVAAGVFGAIKVGGGIIALTAAGPSLLTAGTMLQSAATSLGAQGLIDGKGGGKKSGNFLSNAGSWLAGLGIVAAPAVAADLAIGGPNSTAEYDAQVAEQGRIKDQMWAAVNSFTGLFSPTSGVAGQPDGGLGPDADAYRAQIAQLQADMAEWEEPGMADRLSGLQAKLSEIEQVRTSAETATTSLNGLNAQVAPKVDTSGVSELVRLLQVALELQGRLGVVGAATTAVRQTVKNSYSDFGVAP